MIEIEVQNETHQTQSRLKFAAVPRMGEGLRLLEPDGFWASYDVLDLWYQKADYGDIWVPYIHVRMTTSEGVASPAKTRTPPIENQQDVVDTAKKVAEILQTKDSQIRPGHVVQGKIGQDLPGENQAREEV